MDEKDMIWNRFIDEWCGREPSELTGIRKNAVLCYLYDAEMNSGGFCSFKGMYSEVPPKDMITALMAVGTKEMTDNYIRGLTDEAEQDDWVDIDDEYYAFDPSLTDLLMEYVEKHKDAIFE